MATAVASTVASYVSDVASGAALPLESTMSSSMESVVVFGVAPAMAAVAFALTVILLPFKRFLPPMSFPGRHQPSHRPRLGPAIGLSALASEYHVTVISSRSRMVVSFYLYRRFHIASFHRS